MATIYYHHHTVSHREVRRLLETISDLYGKAVHVTSGDRNHVPKGGSKTSLHLQKRAADLFVRGVDLGKTYQDLKIYISMIFDRKRGYEVIWHGAYTKTGGPHLHIGVYKNKHAGKVRFKTEGLDAASRGEYSLDVRTIPVADPIIK